MANRWSRRLLPVALILSLLFGGGQYFRWRRTQNYWAIQYVDELRNSVIRLEQLKGVTDSGERSLAMAGVYGARLGAVSSGRVLDVMVQDGYPQRVPILDRVQVEMSMFSRDLWGQRGLKPPEPGSRQNDLLSPEDVGKLARVQAIYRDHFDDAVVRSTNYERQRLALIAVHRQLNDEGLTKLLSRPDSLGAGL